MSKSFKINEDITHLKSDGIKKEFSNKIDWKFFNSLQSALMVLEDNDFEVVINIKVRCAGQTHTVYNTQTSWTNYIDFVWPVCKYTTIIYDIKIIYDSNVRGEEDRCRKLSWKVVNDFEEKNNFYFSPLTNYILSDNLGNPVYCFNAEYTKREPKVNENVEVTYDKEKIKELFISVVNWKIYNYIQYLLVKYEDAGFESSIRIYVRLMEGYQSMIYSDRNGWSNAELYKDINLEMITYNVMLCPGNNAELDDWDVCSNALTKIRMELIIKYNGGCYISSPQDVNTLLDGQVLSGYSIDMHEIKK